MADSFQPNAAIQNQDDECDEGPEYEGGYKLRRRREAAGRWRVLNSMGRHAG
jgi:hypothetical protein